MKTAILLLVVGLILGLVAPNYLREIFTGGSVQLPQFLSFKSQPITFNFSVATLARVIGIILVALAIIRFILVRSSQPN